LWRRWQWTCAANRDLKVLTYMAQNAYDFGVSGGDDEEVDIDV